MGKRDRGGPSEQALTPPRARRVLRKRRTFGEDVGERDVVAGGSSKSLALVQQVDHLFVRGQLPEPAPVEGRRLQHLRKQLGRWCLAGFGIELQRRQSMLPRVVAKTLAR